MADRSFWVIERCCTHAMETVGPQNTPSLSVCVIQQQRKSNDRPRRQGQGRLRNIHWRIR